MKVLTVIVRDDLLDHDQGRQIAALLRESDQVLSWSFVGADERPAARRVGSTNDQVPSWLELSRVPYGGAVMNPDGEWRFPTLEECETNDEREYVFPDLVRHTTQGIFWSDYFCKDPRAVTIVNLALEHGYMIERFKSDDFLVPGRGKRKVFYPWAHLYQGGVACVRAIMTTYDAHGADHVARAFKTARALDFHHDKLTARAWRAISQTVLSLETHGRPS